MAGMRNLNDGNVKDIFRRLRKLETSTMLGSASVGEGRLRFYDNSELLIENGALNVTGSASISGILNVSGQTNLIGQTSVTGPMTITGTTVIGGNTNITGELNVTGPTTLDGDTEVGGKLDITGDTTIGGTTEITGITTLRNELIVEQGKKITLGGMVLENQSPGSAAVQMPGGGILSDTTLGMSITNSTRVHTSGGEAIMEGQTLARIQTGTTKIDVTPTAINATGRLNLSGALDVAGNAIIRGGGITFLALPTTASPPNLYVTSGGKLYQSTWTP